MMPPQITNLPQFFWKYLRHFSLPVGKVVLSFRSVDSSSSESKVCPHYQHHPSPWFQQHGGKCWVTKAVFGQKSVFYPNCWVKIYFQTRVVGPHANPRCYNTQVKKQPAFTESSLESWDTTLGSLRLCYICWVAETVVMLSWFLTTFHDCQSL